ncbi:FliH/SctL family protein [Frondihabitans cladoniiphilus]|uniref:Flagellar assembly protein FliH/Type III secretion system HrpE domain-containing protein n=1 Tax=Frondihabitans cladoniiphilus TaxID=715785 RepID=A0ABP8VW80_9MICO
MSDLAFSPVAYPVFRDPGTVQLESDANARGYAAGYAAGLRAAAAETAALRASLQAERDAAVSHAAARTQLAVSVLSAAAASLDARQIALRTETQETLVATALTLAEAILGYEVRENPGSSVVAALTRALTVVDPADVVAVRLNPTDLSVLDADTSDQLGVTLVADASLQRGDAVADLRDGFIDAALGTALDRARTALLGAGAPASAPGGVA